MPIFRRWRAMPAPRACADDPCRSSVADLLAVHRDRARVDGLEMVDAAQERGFPGAGRAEDHNDLARHDIEVDALQHFSCAEGLVHIACLTRGFGGLLTLAVNGSSPLLTVAVG